MPCVSHARSEELKAMFSEYGEVSDCYMPRDHTTGAALGAGCSPVFDHTAGVALGAGCSPVSEQAAARSNSHAA